MSNEIQAQESAMLAETQEPENQTEVQAPECSTSPAETPTSPQTAFADIFEPLVPSFTAEEAQEYIFKLLRARSKSMPKATVKNGKIEFSCYVSPEIFTVSEAQAVVLRSLADRHKVNIKVFVDERGNRLFKDGEHTIILYTELGLKVEAARLSRYRSYAESDLIAEAIRIRRAVKAMKWENLQRIKEGEVLRQRVNLFTRKAALVAEGTQEPKYSTIDSLVDDADRIENASIPQTLQQRITALEEAVSLRDAGAEDAGAKVETAKAALITFVADAVRADFSKRKSLFNLAKALHKIGVVEKTRVSVFAPYIADLSSLVPDTKPVTREERKPQTEGGQPSKKGKKKSRKGGKKPAPAQQPTSDTTDKVVSLDC